MFTEYGRKVIKFYIISKLFKDNEKQLERGENSYTSGNVKTMNFLGNLHPAVIKGKVQASMKSKLYDVEVKSSYCIIKWME